MDVSSINTKRNGDNLKATQMPLSHNMQTIWVKLNWWFIKKVILLTILEGAIYFLEGSNEKGSSGSSTSLRLRESDFSASVDFEDVNVNLPHFVIVGTAFILKVLLFIFTASSNAFEESTYFWEFLP